MMRLRILVSGAHRPRPIFMRSAGLALGAAALLVWSAGPNATGPVGVAWAESHEEGGHDGGSGRGESGSHDDGSETGGEDEHGGGRGGKGGGGHDEGDSGGHDEGDSGGHDEGDSGGHDEGGSGGRKKGSSGGHEEGGSGGHDDADGAEDAGRGPQAGGDGGEGGRGGGAAGSGKPVWAQGGIPEVELGRLNVARSPEQVLDRAYAEALSSFSPEVAAFYSLDLASMERELSTNWDNVQFIDSPLQNLALMRDALDGASVLREVGIATDNDTLLAAFLGTASDKGMAVTADTALAVSAILGQPLSPTEAQALAESAERIRQAILAGHG